VYFPLICKQSLLLLVSLSLYSKMPFGMWTYGAPGTLYEMGGADPPQEGALLGWTYLDMPGS